MPYFTARDGTSLHYRDQGSGPVVFLLHGFGMQSAHWLPFAIPLLKNTRIIMPDFRGFGRSHRADFAQPCALTNYADDLHDLTHHLGLENFKMAGISMGALTALMFQRLYPGSGLSHYLHIDQSPVCLNRDDWRWGLFGEEQSERLERARALISDLTPYIDQATPYKQLPAPLRERLWQELGEFFSSALSRPSHKFLAKSACAFETLRKFVLPTANWPAYINCLRAYLEQDYDLRDTLHQVFVPTTVLVGLKSQMYPKGGQLRIADYREGARTIGLPRSGHTPLIDQPWQFFSILKSFVHDEDIALASS